MIYLLGLLWICSLILIPAVAVCPRKPGVRYTRWDIFSYVLDVVLVCAFLFSEIQFLASGFAGTVAGFEVILKVLDVFTIILLPVSFFTVAASISLRKQGKSRLSWLVQLSTVPFYLVCHVAYYMILF